MNTEPTMPVLTHRTRHIRALALIATRLSLGNICFGIICLGLIQCVEIDGGASEFTWSIRSLSGDKQNCSESSDNGNQVVIDKIRLCWNSVADQDTGCRPGQFREFSCTKEAGVTRFEIPVGLTKFSIEPICTDGQAAKVGTYQVPSTIVRDVKEGEIVTLDAILIEVTDPQNCVGIACTCVRE